MDNWICATVGYSGVKIEIGGKTHEFGSSVFRFRPDLSALEHLQVEKRLFVPWTVEELQKLQ